MNFLDLCYDLFLRTSKYHDLGKDIENWNKWNFYVVNYYTGQLYFTKRKDIEDFIVDVRMDNPIYAAFSQLYKTINNGPLRKLNQLNDYELYIELRGEAPTIIYKGAYDCIKLYHNLDEQQSSDLAKRFALNDLTIFTDYKC